MLPVLDEQEQASFHGAIRRLDMLGDAVLAMVSIDSVPFFSEAERGLYQSVSSSRALRGAINNAAHSSCPMVWWWLRVHTRCWDFRRHDALTACPVS